MHGIFPYIYHKNQPNVGMPIPIPYTIPMDGMGYIQLPSLGAFPVLFPAFLSLLFGRASPVILASRWLLEIRDLQPACW